MALSIDFTNIDYLANGTTRQRAAYQLLEAHQILQKLAQFDPLVAGTIPLDIDIASSDIDILGCSEVLEKMAAVVTVHFAAYPQFSIRRMVSRGESALVANFTIDEFPIEIFGQAIPSHQQYAFQHLLIEHKILQKEGPAFKAKIREMKSKGWKTEPAFAKLIGLTGDPYEALLSLKLD